MNVVLAFLMWCLLFALCWPLALLALIALPVVWLVALPFRLGYAAVEAMLALVKGILFLPSRLLAGSRQPSQAK